MVGMETCIKIQSFNKIYTVVFLKAGLHLWVGFFIEWTLQSCYIRIFAIPKIRLFNRCILSLNIGNYLIPQSPNPNESAAKDAPVGSSRCAPGRNQTGVNKLQNLGPDRRADRTRAGSNHKLQINIKLQCPLVPVRSGTGGRRFVWRE